MSRLKVTQKFVLASRRIRNRLRAGGDDELLNGKSNEAEVFSSNVYIYNLYSRPPSHVSVTSL